jgi:DNA-binding CsgD family transcriptional regulator
MMEVLDTHTPSHSLKTRTVAAWRAEPLYQHVTSRFGLEHILTVPLVGGGRLIGTLNFARAPEAPAFDDRDLVRAAALSCHVSALLARLPSARGESIALTPRELEIARLVAAGLNNLEIATLLRISRNTVKAALKNIFRKLDVSARAELAARLGSVGIV